MRTLLRRFFSWYKEDSARGFFVLSTIAIHLLFISAVVLSPSLHLSKKSSHKLIVKTKQMPPQSPSSEKKGVIATTSAQPVPVAKKNITPPSKPKQNKAPNSEVKKKEPQIVKKEVKPKKTTAPKAAPIKKQSPPQEIAVPKELLEELEERIAKIETKHDKLRRSEKTGSSRKVERAPSLAPSGYEGSISEEDDIGDYSELLIGYLRQQLNLPDFGEVKIQITLTKEGLVEKLVVLKTESEKNKKYLEENLSRLQFPEFKGISSNKKSQTLVITFCNEL